MVLAESDTSQIAQETASEQASLMCTRTDWLQLAATLSLSLAAAAYNHQQLLVTVQLAHLSRQQNLIVGKRQDFDTSLPGL